MDEAIKIVDLVVSSGIVNVFSYDILINGYCKGKRIDEALKHFNEMPQKDLVPDSVMYNTLIKSLREVGRPWTALEL